MPTTLTLATFTAGRLEGPVARAHGDLLGVGVEADVNNRADVQACLRGCLGVHDRLARIVRVREPSGHEVGGVMRGEFATHGAYRRPVASRRAPWEWIPWTKSRLPSNPTSEYSLRTKGRRRILASVVGL